MDYSMIWTIEYMWTKNGFMPTRLIIVSICMRMRGSHIKQHSTNLMWKRLCFFVVWLHHVTMNLIIMYGMEKLGFGLSRDKSGEEVG